MKVSVKSLRERLNRVFKDGFSESVNRERRKKRGYDELESDVTSDVAYGDLPENLDFEDEGVSQSKRSAHGYGLEEPVDYDVPGEGYGDSIEEAEVPSKPKKPNRPSKKREPKPSVAPHLKKTTKATQQLTSVDDKISTLDNFVDDVLSNFGSSVEVSKLANWMIQKAKEVREKSTTGVASVPSPMEDEPTVKTPPIPVPMEDEPTVRDSIREVTPPGETEKGKSYEKVVKAVKKSGSAENPWAVAWAMKKKQK